MTDRDIEREVGLPAAFLNKARAGKNRGERAAPNWAKLRAWIATQKHVGKGLDDLIVVEDIDPTAAEAEGLGSKIEAAKTQRSLGALTTHVAVLVANGFDLKRAEVLEKLIARRSKILKDERSEKAARQVRKLEILTPPEMELLQKHRETLAGPVLKPGEAAPPPIEDPT